MLIKTVTLHSLSYLVGITSSVAVHQVIPSPGTASVFQSGTAAIGHQQVANRSTKSDKLPIRQAKRQLNVPSFNFGTNCKPPIDVRGRCFADAGGTRKVALSVRGPLRGIPIALNQIGPDATDLV